MTEKHLVEIARSFSYKLNLGNYQTADFFCSQKAEVPESKAEETSEALYEFCKREVMKSVNSYLEEKSKRKEISDKDAQRAHEEFEANIREGKQEQLEDDLKREQNL
jgi:tryptophanyl-tRNA synthetase